MFDMMVAIYCLAAFILVSNVEGEEIYALPVDQGVRQWRDMGMCCEVLPDLTIFAPLPPSSTALDWFSLGHRAQTNHNSQPNEAIHTFAEIAMTQALTRPEGFTFIWDDRLSTALSSGSAWRVNCPANYAAIGDMFYPENRITNPDGLYDEVRCVRADLTVECSFTNSSTWTSEGSTGLYRGSVWAVNTTENGLDTDFLYATRGFDDPPALVPKCLKTSAVVQLYRDSNTGMIKRLDTGMIQTLA